MKGYNGDTITLILPAEFAIGNNTKVTPIDWLSMYCIRFQHNFGHVRLSARGAELSNSTHILPSVCVEENENKSMGNGLVSFGLIMTFAFVLIKLF